MTQSVAPRGIIAVGTSVCVVAHPATNNIRNIAPAEKQYSKRRCLEVGQIFSIAQFLFIGELGNVGWQSEGRAETSPTSWRNF